MNHPFILSFLKETGYPPGSGKPMKDTKPELIRAARVHTMTPGRPPLNNAAVLVDGQTIRGVGLWSEMRSQAPTDRVTDLGDVALCPGLLNPHTHLEMSHLHGRTVAGQGFGAWIRSLVAQPLYDLDPGLVRAACREMHGRGVVYVGDISTRNAATVAGLLQASGLFFTAFSEAIFFDPPEEDREYIPPGRFENGCLAAAGHALYTTNPETMRRAKAADAALGLPFSLHLAEHQEEVDMLLDGSGPLPGMLAHAGIGLEHFTPPGMRPVPYAEALGLLDKDTLAVHCVRIDQADVDTLARTQTNVCLCPRSNKHIGVGHAPWTALMEAGVNLCLGTDGLCSNDDLDLWNEAAYIKTRLDREWTLGEALATMTRNTAKAMGVDRRLGTLEPGRAARWAVVPDWFEDMFS